MQFFPMPITSASPSRARRTVNALTTRDRSPYVARATYPALGFPQYAGEVGASDADPAAKAAAQKAAAAAIAEPLDVFHKFYMHDGVFIGGVGYSCERQPSVTFPPATGLPFRLPALPEIPSSNSLFQ